MKQIIKNKKKSEILAEQIASMKYGDVISHEQISKIIEERYGSPKYYSTITAAKKALQRNYGKIIENIHEDGYRVVCPDDYTDTSLKHYKRGFSEMQKGTDTLACAPIKDMSIEGREIYRRVHDRAVILQASMNGAKAELKTLSSKKHPFLAAVK